MAYYSPYSTQMLYHNYAQYYPMYQSTDYRLMRGKINDLISKNQTIDFYVIIVDGSFQNYLYAVDGESDKMTGIKMASKIIFGIVKVAFRMGLSAVGGGDGFIENFGI